MKRYLPVLEKKYSLSNSSKFSSYELMKRNNDSMMVSDHLAKVNLLHEYIKCKNKNTFCAQNLLNKNNVKRAVLVRDQLQEYLNQILKERNKKTFFDLTKANINTKSCMDVSESILNH